MFGIDKDLDQFEPFNAKPTAYHLKPAAALAPRTFRRISAQWGTFTVHPKAESIPEAFPEDHLTTKILVSATEKNEILRELEAVGIDERVIYSDLHHLGKSIKARYL